MTAPLLTWLTAGVATFGLIVRPFGWAEYLWALGGAIALVVLGILSWPDALAAAGKGTDVYLFLIGMMLLSELARQQGLFDYLAAHAVRYAKGSASRLFAIIFGVGTIVTVFLSNDATAVVLTPAVYAAAKAAKANPLPYLFICAFVANAASFVLPISNPANLVIYRDHMPALPVWLAHFALPSILSILVTFGLLRVLQRGALTEKLDGNVSAPPLRRGGKVVAAGICATTIVLLAASTLDLDLGLPTFLAALLVAIVVTLIERLSPLGVVKQISWGVLPLVAGLFILVEGVARTGALDHLAAWLQAAAQQSPQLTTGLAGVTVALVSNVINNLPMGLIAASVGHASHVDGHVIDGLLVGVDLGPNLSVTGSLATILWLIVLRREGVSVKGIEFFKLGIVLMPAALLAALAALIFTPGL